MAERKPVIEGLAEFSKKVDYFFIAIGSGIYVIFNKAVGAIIVIGSVLTLIPAKWIQSWSKKRGAKATA